MGLSLLSVAQPRHIRLIGTVSADNFAKYFNTDTVQLRQLNTSKTPAGVFVAYEKADTLNFKHEFYKSFDGPGYTKVGLAFYARKGNDYQLSFRNDNAFFCASCNNMSYYNVTASRDTVSISISWGPNAFGQNEGYYFVYRPAIKRWQLAERDNSGSDDEGTSSSEYMSYSKNVKVFLDDYNAESLSYDSTVISSQGIGISYKPGDYAALLRSLKEIPKNSLFLLPRVFNEHTAQYFMENSLDEEQPDNANPIQAKNVRAANDIAYFLEQANQLDAAQVFLDKVIERFPEREVAYLNRGDVFFKRGQSSYNKAEKDYQTYVALMDKRGLQAKIPRRVFKFLSTQ
jgi:tetratricopeptide (TPR) repeat protein